MTKLEPFVHVKSHNPRNGLLQTEGGGESHNFLRHLGAVEEGCRGRREELQVLASSAQTSQHRPYPGQGLLPLCVEERVNSPAWTSASRLKFRNQLCSDVGTSEIHRLELGGTVSTSCSTRVRSPAPNPLVNRTASPQPYKQFLHIMRWRDTDNVLADNVRVRVVQYQSGLVSVLPAFLWEENEGSWQTHPGESPGNTCPTKPAHSGPQQCSGFVSLA